MLSNDVVTANARKRRRYPKEAFYDALRRSFAELVNNGEANSFTKAKIILNAKYIDGTPVGETTLYGKNPKTKEFIHRDFILELESLIDDSLRKPNGPSQGRTKKAETSSDAVKRLRAEKKELELENASILAQFVKLEESSRNLKSISEMNRIKSLEMELFIVSSVLNRRLGGSISEIVDSVSNYEVKHADQPRLAQAKEEIANLEKRINDSAVTSMFGTMSGKC